MNFLYLSLGTLFGFLLSRARASDYNTIVNMFRFEDLHLMGVMGVAIGVAAVGLVTVRRKASRALIGCAIEIQPKASRPGMFVAAIIFGTGWALSGT
jgi:uncharacterized membrane protein YedE/YeeE